MAKYPQKADFVEINGEKALYLDGPSMGNGIAMYLPDIVFDELYSKELNYKFRFKAKRGNGEVIGEDDFNVYIRHYDDASQRAGQTSATFIEKSNDFVQYEIVVPSTSIPATSVRMTGLFNAGSNEAFRDLYIKDIEVFVKDNSKPMLSFDMPSYIPPKGMHPRVYFTKDDIATIKANSTHPQNKAAYETFLKDIAAKGDGSNKGTGDNLNDNTMGIIQSKAFYYAVLIKAQYSMPNKPLYSATCIVSPCSIPASSSTIGFRLLKSKCSAHFSSPNGSKKYTDTLPPRL